MRANGKSTYQIKKEKLQKIKKLLIILEKECKQIIDNDFEIDRLQTECIETIWKIVKDE